jgi:hypothetical protein
MKMIPGAFEARIVPHETRPTWARVAPAPTMPGGDFEQLQLELEGGGAASERTRPRRSSLAAKFRDLVLHPRTFRALWQHPLPQDR